MSHATLTVALPGTVSENEIREALAVAMAPYDENLPTPRYVKYTKAQLVEKGRKEIEECRDGIYAEFLADPAAYAEKRDNLRHLTYLAGGDAAAADIPGVFEKCAELLAEHESMRRSYAARHPEEAHAFEYRPTTYEGSFPAKLDWTDEQIYASEIRWYEPEDIGEEGEIYSQYNPNSKWDWYSIGGRWAGYWKVIEGPALGDAPTIMPNMTESAWSGPLGEFLGDADREYVAEMNARPGPRTDVSRKFEIDFDDPDLYPATFAFLDSDGVWHEKARMGMFGMTSGDKDADVWTEEYRHLLSVEADNAWLVMVDYHI